MGKAARSKGSQGETRRKRLVDSFMRRAGVSVPSTNQQMWAAVESRLGRSFAQEFDRAIENRRVDCLFGRPVDQTVYDLAFRDLDTALATAPFVTPMLRGWGTFIQELTLPAGRVIDLGSGSGILACFYASIRPDSTITAVEINAAGVRCGEALADRLGLSNIEFLQGDVRNLGDKNKFSVVLSVAALTEMEEPAFDVLSPFGLVKSARQIFYSATSELASIAAMLTADNGVYASLERQPGLFEGSAWTGSLQNAGFACELSSSRRVKWGNSNLGVENSDAVVARKGGAVDAATFEDFISWYRLAGGRESESCLAELELIECDSVTMVAGRQFDIEDGQGVGQTRLYLLQRDADAVLYMSTSRGWASLMRRARDVTALQNHYRSTLSQFRSSPMVVGESSLSASDLEEELGRQVVAS